MPLNSSELRRFVNGALLSASGVPSPDRTQLIASFTVLCDQLRQQLLPIFGTAATVALFARALQLATHEYPWLGELKLSRDRCSLDAFESAREGLDGDELAAGLGALLAQDIALLIAFVGEDLILPLVRGAWGRATIAPTTPATDKGNQ
jgi:hypothetical protein